MEAGDWRNRVQVRELAKVQDHAENEVWSLFFMEKPEPSTEANADQVGGKVGKDADVSE